MMINFLQGRKMPLTIVTHPEKHLKLLHSFAVLTMSRQSQRLNPAQNTFG